MNQIEDMHFGRIGCTKFNVRIKQFEKCSQDSLVENGVPLHFEFNTMRGIYNQRKYRWQEIYSKFIPIYS